MACATHPSPGRYLHEAYAMCQGSDTPTQTQRQTDALSAVSMSQALSLDTPLRPQHVSGRGDSAQEGEVEPCHAATPVLQERTSRSGRGPAVGARGKRKWRGFLSTGEDRGQGGHPRSRLQVEGPGSLGHRPDVEGQLPGWEACLGMLHVCMHVPLRVRFTCHGQAHQTSSWWLSSSLRPSWATAPLTLGPLQGQK